MFHEQDHSENTSLSQSPPPTPASEFSVTATLDVEPRENSLWHQSQSLLVDRLFARLSQELLSESGFGSRTSSPSSKPSHRVATGSALMKEFLNALVPYLIQVHAPHSNGQRDKKRDDPESKSLFVANCTLNAINYSLCLEQVLVKSFGTVAASQVLFVHDRRIRLILLAFFVMLIRNLSQSQLVHLISDTSLQFIPVDASRIWSVRTVTDILSHSFLSFERYSGDLYSGGKATVASKHDPKSYWKMSLKLFGLFLDSLSIIDNLYHFEEDKENRRNIKTPDYNVNLAVVNISDQICRKVIREVSTWTSYHQISNSHISSIISTYNALIPLVRLTVHDHPIPDNIKVLSHILVFLKHTLIAVICFSISANPVSMTECIIALRSFIRHLKRIAKRSRASTEWDFQYLAEYCDIWKQHFERSNENTRRIFSSELSKNLCEWINRSQSSQESKLVRFLVLPVIELFATALVNFDDAEKLLIGITSESKRLNDTIFKWIVSILSEGFSGGDNQSSESPEQNINTCTFVCNLLVHIPSFDPSGVLDYIISLFTISRSTLRDHISRCAAICSLNMRGSGRGMYRHRLDGKCRLFESESTPRKYIQSSGSTAFRIFLYYWDSCINRFASTETEKNCFVSFLYHITHHLLHTCPSAVEDPIAFELLASEFTARIARRQVSSNSSSETEYAVSLRQTYGRLAFSVLKGSWGTAERRSGFSRPCCHPIVFKPMLRVLQRLWCDPDPSVQETVLDACEFLLGVKEPAHISLGAIDYDSLKSIYLLVTGVDRLGKATGDAILSQRYHKTVSQRVLHLVEFGLQCHKIVFYDNAMDIVQSGPPVVKSVVEGQTTQKTLAQFGSTNERIHRREVDPTPRKQIRTVTNTLSLDKKENEPSSHKMSNTSRNIIVSPVQINVATQTPPKENQRQHPSRDGIPQKQPPVSPTLLKMRCEFLGGTEELSFGLLESTSTTSTPIPEVIPPMESMNSRNVFDNAKAFLRFEDEPTIVKELNHAQEIMSTTPLPAIELETLSQNPPSEAKQSPITGTNGVSATSQNDDHNIIEEVILEQEGVSALFAEFKPEKILQEVLINIDDTSPVLKNETFDKQRVRSTTEAVSLISQEEFGMVNARDKELANQSGPRLVTVHTPLPSLNMIKTAVVSPIKVSSLAPSPARSEFGRPLTANIDALAGTMESFLDLVSPSKLPANGPSRSSSSSTGQQHDSPSLSLHEIHPHDTSMVVEELEIATSPSRAAKEQEVIDALLKSERPNLLPDPLLLSNTNRSESTHLVGDTSRNTRSVEQPRVRLLHDVTSGNEFTWETEIDANERVSEISEHPVDRVENETILIQTRPPVAPHPFVRTRMTAAIQLVLKNLLFDRMQKQTIDYFLMYEDGLKYGSLISLASLPAHNNVVTGSKPKGDSDMLDHPVVHEALHPLLKQVFSLDQTIFIDICSNMSIQDDFSVAASSTFPESPRRQLQTWLSGLTQVHKHLIPVSAILFRMEREMKTSLTVSQAMVIIRDQVTLFQLTAGPGQNLRNQDLSALKSALLGGGNSLESFAIHHTDIKSLSRLDLRKSDPASFMQWIRETSFHQ